MILCVSSDIWSSCRTQSFLETLLDKYTNIFILFHSINNFMILWTKSYFLEFYSLSDSVHYYFSLTALVCCSVHSTKIRVGSVRFSSLVQTVSTICVVSTNKKKQLNILNHENVLNFKTLYSRVLNIEEGQNDEVNFLWWKKRIKLILFSQNVNHIWGRRIPK